jgi:hypothetical protein
MSSGVADFEKKMLECLDDLNGLLPGLSLRYEMPVIIGAMAEHVGSAIWALRHKKLCDTRQANLAIQHLECAAFPGESAPMP